MKENKIIIITTILNFIVAILKVVTGLLFSFSTLIADSIQSFVDFITDITSLIANKIGKRRANKMYPFGYGQIYYLANFFTGFLLFLIGIFILYQFFFFKAKFIPSIKIGYILFVVLVLKYAVVYLLKTYGKEYKSELMIEASTESNADFISTCVVLAILIVSFFEEYIPSYINIDKLGSLGMAVYVFYTAIKMMISNLYGMLTNDVENNDLKKEIENEVSNYKKFELKKIRIIKMSAYYSVFLQLKVNSNMSIKKYIEMEKELKSHLKSKNKMIRFVDIEVI